MVPGVIGMISVEFLGRVDEGSLAAKDVALLKTVVALWRNEKEPEANQRAKAIALLREHQDAMSPSMQSLLDKM
jgi:hypothetical protein